MKNQILTILVLFIAVKSNAGSLECASADSKLKYSYSQSDGGAAMKPTSSLTLENQTLIDQPQFGHETRIAVMTFSGKVSNLGKAKSSDYETTWYSQKLKVTSNQDQSILFNEPVLCKRAVYIGIPRP